MNDSLDPCKRFWCDVGEAGGDPESIALPGRLDHLTGCAPCRSEYSDLVARWSNLRGTLAPPGEVESLTEDRAQDILDAMRRAAQGEEPGENPDAGPDEEPGEGPG